MHAGWHHAHLRLSLAAYKRAWSCCCCLEPSHRGSRSTASWNLHGAARLLPWLLQHRQFHLRSHNDVLEHIKICIFEKSCVLIFQLIWKSHLSLGNLRGQTLHFPGELYYFYHRSCGGFSVFAREIFLSLLFTLEYSSVFQSKFNSAQFNVIFN